MEYVLRLYKTDTTRISLTWTLDGMRKQGRPKLTWWQMTIIELSLYYGWVLQRKLHYISGDDSLSMCPYNPLECKQDEVISRWVQSTQSIAAKSWIAPYTRYMWIRCESEALRIVTRYIWKAYHLVAKVLAIKKLVCFCSII